MQNSPEPKTLEEALRLFPGVTVSARHFRNKWSFLIDSKPQFIYDETGWRKTWQEAFRVMWKKYKTYTLD